MGSFNNLRLRRLRHRITKREMAHSLGCVESWINALELGHYHGPARHVWADKYESALNQLIDEKKVRK